MTREWCVHRHVLETVVVEAETGDEAARLAEASSAWAVQHEDVASPHYAHSLDDQGNTVDEWQEAEG